ncbi:MAG: carboxymuconolactone decarboxylase family protein [Firmicutes bacterium]|nr:carboxymuconolactone decarboxylase family protein [Bacillota bacterium]
MAIIPPFVEALKDKDPELYAQVCRTIELAMSPGALDERTKILIALGIDAYKGAERGVKMLANQARALGVTEAQIAEVLRITYFIAGLDSIATGLNAYKPL